MTISGTARRRILLPSPDEASFGRRGFSAADPAARQRLEETGRVFLRGLAVGLQADRAAQVVAPLAAVGQPVRGFAFEGAAMGLAIGDALTPWPRREVARFAAGPGAPHIYLVHVGIGWALARLPRVLWHRVALPDPLLRWLALDGYGFHQAYFHTGRYVHAQHAVRLRPPWPDPSGYASRVADQGIGRALWFVGGAGVARVAALVQAFDPQRRGDLWSGVGLAAAYAGGAGGDALSELTGLAGEHRPALAQGAAFAAKARMYAGLVTADTVEAVRVLCDSGIAAAGLCTDDALQDLPPDLEVPAFEVWRRRVQSALRSAGTTG